MSSNAYNTDTRFGEAEYWIDSIKEITGKEILHTMPEVEPIGPKKILDLLIIAPCTGNTLAKLANGITDTPVTMACKSQWRNQRPVLIGISTNDGLGFNLKNIATLLMAQNTYFIPFGQDNCVEKPNSLIAEMSLLVKAADAAINKTQLQPVIITYR